MKMRVEHDSISLIASSVAIIHEKLHTTGVMRGRVPDLVLEILTIVLCSSGQSPLELHLAKPRVGICV